MALSLLLAGCAGRAPPAPGTEMGSVPDLGGARVMLLPFQALEGGVEEGADVELGYALTQRGRGVDWVLPGALERALVSSPGLDARVRDLPVAVFLRAEVRRIGDPLYGYLRRLGALVDAEVALLPVVARHREESPARAPAVEMAAALVEVRTGRVLWFGMVEGSAGRPEDPGALATAAEALAARLLPAPRGAGPQEGSEWQEEG